MPIPGGTPTVPATPVVSSDLVLTVTPRSEWAAAKIKVDFTKLTGTSTAWTVTVSRADGTVRGLDALIAPKGVCVGWDQELTLGAAATWTARCYNRAGTLVATSGAVSASIPRTALTWIKDLTDPRLSTPFIVNDEVAWQRARSPQVSSPVGARYPSVASDVRKAGTGSQQVHTLTVAEVLRMRALLEGGPAYLVQPGIVATANGSVDVYAAIGDVTETPLSANFAYRGWDLPLTRIARPATAGSSIPIPGLTFGEAPAVAWSSSTGKLVDYVGV